ncbi:MAG: GNAT family N-acetyltransferase [Wenzhouxiangellaceae bacterium]
MMIPSLETDRLTLVAPDVNAFDLYKAFYTDAEASSFYGGPLSVEQTWARLKADVGSWYLLGYGVWVVQDKIAGRAVGSCGFWKGKDWPIELTWWMLPDARGKGYATEASLAAIQFGYRQLRWNTVETYMNDENIAARNLVLKLGGVKNRRQMFPDGLERDVYTLPEPA